MLIHQTSDVKEVLDNIRKIDITSPSLGFNAQRKMSHTGRRFHPQEGAVVRDAAVVHLIYPKAEHFHFVLIRRTARNPNDKHGGQVGLAGGAREFQDRNLQDTAMRELYEEIGVQVSQKDMVRALSPLYIPVSGFQVQPFLAVLDQTPTFQLQASEVEYLIEVPLRELFEEGNKAASKMEINQKFVLEKVPHYNFFDHIVWGATAMMLSELEALLIASNYRV